MRIVCTCVWQSVHCLVGMQRFESYGQESPCELQARGYDRVGFTWSTRGRLSHTDTSLFLCCQMMFATFLNLSCLPCTIINVDLFLVGEETPVRPRMHT